MKNFRLSKLADTDLRNIAQYTQVHWGKPQRNEYIQDFFHTFSQLAETPDIAISIDPIRAGYKKYPQGSHVIFFRATESGGIEIIRILHKRMDVDAHL